MTSSALSYRPFKMQDLCGFEPKTGIFSSESELASRLENLVHSDKAYTYSVVLGHKVIAIIGIVQDWKGVGTVWSVTSEHVRKVPIGFHKLIIAMIKAHEKIIGLHRVQMTVREDYEEGQKWAFHLGFKPEGVLHQYGPDRANHVIFSRLSHG